jgi:hypothetical protein
MIGKNKLFLAFETGEWRPNFLKATVKGVFKGWDIKSGDEILPPEEKDRIAYQEVLEHMQNAYVIVDLTGAKRPEDGGINPNVLLEYGMALALAHKCHAIYCSEHISREVIEKRISDIKGCGIYNYKDKRELREKIEEAKISFEKHLKRKGSKVKGTGR